MASVRLASIISALVAVSWALDASSPGLEMSVRVIFLLGCVLLLKGGLGGILRQGRLQLLGGYVLLSGVWLFRGVNGGAEWESAVLDLLLISTLFFIAVSPQRSDHWPNIALAKPTVGLLSVGMISAVTIGVASNNGGRGELPPTMLVAVAAILVLKGKRLGGAICLGGYLALAASSGFRSSVLLAVLGILLVGFQLFRDASLGGKSILLIASVPLAIWAAPIAQVAVQSESAQSLRAVEFVSGGAGAISSDEARISELRSVGELLGNSSMGDLILGRGHGATVLGEGFERRTAHNVWVTFVVRYGAAGLVASLVVHLRILRRITSRRGDGGLGVEDFIAVAGMLVLMNGYLRFAIAELSELIALGLAAGVIGDRES